MSNQSVILSQAIISGRILDPVCGQPVTQGLRLSLWYRPVPEEDAEPADYCPAGLRSKVTRDGYFCFSASGGLLFGNRDTMPDIQFRLDIEAPGYQPLSHHFELASETLTSARADMDLAGDSHSVRRITGPFHDIYLELLPRPVHLRGQVLLDGDPDTPLNNAEVTLSAPEIRPPVTTDGRGFFFMESLPLAREVSLTLSDGRDEQSRTVILDYRQPVNSRRFIFREAP